MVDRIEIPIVRRQGEAASKFISAQRLRNAFLEIDPETGEAAIHGAPGLSEYTTVGSGPIRGVHKMGAVLLVVSGAELYTVAEGGAATLRGTVAGTADVVMANNGDQAAIVADETSYIYTAATGVVAAITDPDFLGATSVDFLDQYFVFSIPDSGAIQISALADGTSYDALDIATAETRPDDLKRVLVSNREALLFGDDTGEGWENVGDADFPLVRAQTFVEVGLIGRDAVTRIDNTVAFVASDKTVRILRGGTPQIISDPFVTAEMSAWADLSTVRAFSFVLRGHAFLVLRHADGCLLWDASLPPNVAWSSRRSYGSNTWRVAHCEAIWGKIIAADATTNQLFELSDAVYAEDGDPLVSDLRSRTMGPGGRRFTVHAIEVEIEPGVGLATGQGSDPKVWLECSRDGGHIFGARMERALGATGVRPRRIVWRGLGQFPPTGGVIGLGMSDPVRLAIKRAWADITVDAT